MFVTVYLSAKFLSIIHCFVNWKAMKARGAWHGAMPLAVGGALRSRMEAEDRGYISDCGLWIAESKVSGAPPEADQVSGQKDKKLKPEH